MVQLRHEIAVYCMNLATIFVTLMVCESVIIQISAITTKISNAIGISIIVLSLCIVNQKYIIHCIFVYITV